MEEEPGRAVSGTAEIAWRRIGTGQPLLLVNGYAATSADWDPTFIEQLAGFAQLICPDNRGVGASSRGEGELTVELMARDLLAVLDACEIERAAVAGWSMGGFVAQELAAAAPGRVERLALLSTDPGGPGAVRAEEETWASLTDHSGSAREQASRLISLLFPPSIAPGIDEQFGDLVAAARSELDPDTLSAQEAAMHRWYSDPSSNRLAAIEAPAFCAAGAADVVIPPANTETLGERLPGPSPVIFADGGHAFMAQEPVRLAALIEEFLAA